MRERHGENNPNKRGRQAKKKRGTDEGKRSRTEVNGKREKGKRDERSETEKKTNRRDSDKRIGEIVEHEKDRRGKERKEERKEGGEGKTERQFAVELLHLTCSLGTDLILIRFEPLPLLDPRSQSRPNQRGPWTNLFLFLSASSSSFSLSLDPDPIPFPSIPYHLTLSSHLKSPSFLRHHVEASSFRQ